MTREELSKLQDTVDEILDGALRARIDGPVNWADLSCSSAREWRDCYGNHGLTVFIEEAAPDANSLHDYVRTELERRNWKGVEVVTEW